MNDFVIRGVLRQLAFTCRSQGLCFRAMVVREVNDDVIDLQDDVRGSGSCHNSAYEASVRTFAMRQCNVMT